MTSVQIVAGGAGFIGVNLLRRLLEEDKYLVVLDNLSRGQREYLESLGAPDRIVFRACDLSRRDEVRAAFSAASEIGLVGEVWHLAANSDIPAGVADPDIDLRDTFLTTFEILRAMREFGIDVLHFASSSAIYGDLGDVVLTEDVGPLLPISNYGAMKLASEAQATAAAEAGLQRVNIFRFPNVVGVPATHGVIMDFARKLQSNPSRLDVLGDGTQQKAYLHVSDLVDAMLAVRARPKAGHGRVEVVNIGPVDEGVKVRWIAEQVVARIFPDAGIVFGAGNKGWVGDVPKFSYSTERLRSFGWTPRMDSAAAIRRAVDEIALQHGF
jgi:UDP-glucose 4-epimerase